MKPILILLIPILFIFACSETTVEPIVNTDNKFVSISPLELQGEITSMKFFDQHHAILTSSSGSLLNTLDGGNTWTDTSIFEQSNLENLFFYNEDFGFCTSNDTNTFIYDTGKWSYFNFPVKNCPVSSIYFLSEKQIYATTLRGSNEHAYMVRSNNGGITWDTLYSAYADFTQVLFINEQTGFIITKSDNKIGLMKTNDGGSSWYGRIPSVYGTYFNGSIRLVKLLAVNSNNLLLIGRGNKTTEGIIISSNDGGENWKTEIVPFALNDVAATSNHIYFVGDEHFATQWKMNPSAFTNPAYIIDNWTPFNPETDFLINERGYLVLQYHNIVDVQFIDDNTGFIATNNNSMVFKINIVAQE